MTEQNHIGRPCIYATMEKVQDLEVLMVTKLQDLGKLIEQRFDAQDKALILQASKNTAEFSHIKDNIDSLKTYRDTQQGRASQSSVFIGWGIALLAIAISVVASIVAMVR